MPYNDVLKVYAASLGFSGSDTMYRILETLFAKEGDIALAGAMPGTIGQLAASIGLSPERVRADAERLRITGAIDRKGDVYRLFPAMIELRDATVLWPHASQELFELWERLIWGKNELSPLMTIIEKSNIPPMMRTVPIERSIKTKNAVLDIDSARKIFEDAELVSAMPCACRTQARKNGRGIDCPAPEDVLLCLQTNAFADAFLGRGLGEQISNDEALRRIGLAEDAGLVHMARNNVKKDMIMCNCCSCCCTGFHFLNTMQYADAFAPSRFRVKLDPHACSGCGICEEKCQFQAITVDNLAHIREDRCYGCGNCVVACPEEALTLEEVRPREHIRIT